MAHPVPDGTAPTLFDVDETLERERDFHDRLARELEPARLPPRAAGQFEALEVALFARLGDIRGKRLLELGCGAGDLTLAFAQAGARVTALDVSSGMVDVARQRVARFVPGGAVAFVEGAAEAVPAANASFDLVVGKWILHHTDLDVLIPEVARLLAPGGRAIFIENSGLNPILRLARERVAGRFGVRRVGTPDEHPLVEADFERFAEQFGVVRRHYPQFDFLRLLDRQIFRFRRPLVSKVCNGVDDFVERRLPRLRRYSFRVIVELAH